MKYILLLLLIISFTSCGQQTSGGVYYVDATYPYQQTIFLGYDKVLFTVQENYQNGYGNITTMITNQSNDKSYNSFDYEIQCFQNGMIVQSSGVYTCYNLFPGQSQEGCNIVTNQIYDPQFIKIVIRNVHSVALTVAN